jgi:transposase, IS30 family
MKKEVNKIKHLTAEERDKITILHAQGLSLRNIAKELGRSPSTISRELNRKEAVFFRGNYLGSQTHGNVKRKWIKTHQKHKIINKNLRKYIEQCLKIGFSPETIAGRLKEKYDVNIHHETIYRFVYKDRTDLAQYLLRRKFGRKPRQKFKKIKPMKSMIPNRIDIDFRDEKANLRLEFGHFEVDSVESGRTRGKKRNSCLTVIVDRTTRKTTILKTASKTSAETNKSITKALKTFKLIKSITYDNGLEFAKHEEINKSFGTKSYFCKPYHSWEKGTVENINGLIRRFFPKGTNFDTISRRKIEYVENWINNRPMKVLNFKTPNEKFKELMKVS